MFLDSDWEKTWEIVYELFPDLKAFFLAFPAPRSNSPGPKRSSTDPIAVATTPNDAVEKPNDVVVETVAAEPNTDQTSTPPADTNE